MSSSPGEPIFSPAGQSKVRTVSKLFAKSKNPKVLSAGIIAGACKAVAGSKEATDFIEHGDNRAAFEMLLWLLRPPTSDNIAQSKKVRHTSVTVEKRLSPQRSVLVELVRKLSTKLLEDTSEATWLLESLPEECRAIASAFSQSDQADRSVDSSQAATLLGKKRAESLTSEHQRKAATARSTKLSAEERSKIARAAALKRWSKEKDGK